MKICLSIALLFAWSSLLTGQAPALIKGSREAATAIGRMHGAEMDRRARMTPEEQAALAKREKEQRDFLDLSEARKCPLAQYRRWTIEAVRHGFSVENPRMAPGGYEGDPIPFDKLEDGRPIIAKPFMLSKVYVWLKPKNEKDGKEPIKVMRVHLPKNENRMLELIDRQLDQREAKEQFKNRSKVDR